MSMNIKAMLLDVFYGKRKLIETVDMPGIIIVKTLAPYPEILLEVVPKADIWKRPRQKYSIMEGVYLRLPFSIPVPHSIVYYENSEGQL